MSTKKGIVTVSKVGRGDTFPFPLEEGQIPELWMIWETKRLLVDAACRLRLCEKRVERHGIETYSKRVAQCADWLNKYNAETHSAIEEK